MINILFLFLYTCFENINPKTECTHAFHISRCEINYETTSGDIQVAAHIFIDDLESTLGNTGNKNLYIGTTKENPRVDQVIEKYINDRLQINIANKPMTLSLIGKETSKDKLAVWCYLEISGLKNVKRLEIENKILTELYNDQKNIVDFTVDKKKKHFTIFDTKKTEDVYIW